MTGAPSTRSLIASALGGLIVLALAVGLASIFQRDAARSGLIGVETGRAMLEGMVEQETGLRGFALTKDEDFLEPYIAGERLYATSLRRARKQVAGDREATALLAGADTTSRRWKDKAALAIVRTRAGERAFGLGPSRERKAAMDRYRGVNAQYLTLIRGRAARLETRAAVLSVLLIVVLAGAFAAVGLMATRRVAAHRRVALEQERRFVARQRDLNFGLQVTESEEEAQGFLYRHLEQTIAGSEVVVLKRNNSANRLLPGTPIAPGSKLDGAFSETEPRSCMAVRLAQRRGFDADQNDSVLSCGICGRLGTPVTCSPLLVGGEVIGSVLVSHPEPLTATCERALDESVKQAAPVLANLRNLAIAETRAATDGLTGLPNRRAFDESLKRMAAHATRAMSPLAAVALDLDHFKQVNDVYGHGRGDEVLAEVGALLAAMVRDSDFVARVGGEEFMMLLPDTGRDGALIICERIRGAIAAIEFPAMGHGVTASFGVAVLPDDETDASNLVRGADRLLYTAKERGRNRVEISELALGAEPDGQPMEALA